MAPPAEIGTRGAILVLERVEEEGVLERLARALALAADGVELALRQRVRVGEQPSHDRALAVVDVPGGGDDPQRYSSLGVGGGTRGRNRLGRAAPPRAPARASP